MRDSAGKPADGFHLLSLAELLFQGSMFSHVLGEQFEERRVVFVANGSAGKAHGDGNAVLAEPVSNQTVEALRGAKMIGDHEPLLRVCVQVG